MAMATGAGSGAAAGAGASVEQLVAQTLQAATNPSHEIVQKAVVLNIKVCGGCRRNRSALNCGWFLKFCGNRF